MSQIEVERFLGRLMTDAVFRKKAASLLNKCCFDEGFALSEEELTLLQRLDIPRFDNLSEMLDDSLKRN